MENIHLVSVQTEAERYGLKPCSFSRVKSEPSSVGEHTRYIEERNIVLCSYSQIGVITNTRTM